MPFKPRFRLAIILAAVILLVGASLFFALRKTVTLSVDDESRILTTYAFTVGSLLHEQNISLSPLDDLHPSSADYLKNGDQVSLQRAIPIQVLTGGKLVTIYSPDRTPASFLTQAGVSIHPGDQVLSDGRVIDLAQPFPSTIKSISLQIIHSVSFSITDQGQVQSFSSSAPTLGSALWSAGITFFISDQLDPVAPTPLTGGLSAVLQRSRPVTIQTLAGHVNLRTAGETVGEALTDAGLTLQALDYSLPPPEASLPLSGVIQVVHVTEEVLVEQSPLPFETQYQPVDNLELDGQSIVQAGEYGLTAQRVRVRYEDDQETSRTVEDQWVARQPLPRIIGYGTLLTMQTESVDGIQIEYWRKLNMYATSYHPSEVGGTTASGLPLQKGVAAVDINYIPFFTQMYVPGYGEVVAADIGGGVVGRWIDLGYSDNDYVPWHQWVTVYLLWPPPDHIVWIVP